MNVRSLLQATRLVTIFALLSTSIVTPGQAAAIASNNTSQVESAVVKQLTPPSELGQVVDAYVSNAQRVPGSAPLVIQIQDLHANYSVQSNIAKMLEFLDGRLGAGNYKVGIEGAEGPLAISQLGKIQDKNFKVKVCDALMKEAELTGTEYFSIVNGKMDVLWGAEDERYHRANIELFQKTYKGKQQLAVALGQVETQIQPIKTKFYSHTMEKLDHKSVSYAHGKLSTESYAKYLAHLAIKQGVDVIGQYPEIAKWSGMARMDEYPNMDKLQTELADLSGKLESGLAKTDVQQNVAQVASEIDLLKRFAQEQVTTEEVRYLAPKLSEVAGRAKTLLDSVGAVYDKQNLSELISAGLDYYVIALSRDKFLTENALKLFNPSPALVRSSAPTLKAVILVAGGFHTPGISKILKEKGISYITIAPNVTEQTARERELYVARLMGEHSDPEVIANVASDRMLSWVVSNEDGIIARTFNRVLRGPDRILLGLSQPARDAAIEETQQIIRVTPEPRIGGPLPVSIRRGGNTSSHIHGKLDEALKAYRTNDFENAAELARVVYSQLDGVISAKVTDQMQHLEELNKLMGDDEQTGVELFEVPSLMKIALQIWTEATNVAPVAGVQVQSNVPTLANLNVEFVPDSRWKPSKPTQSFTLQTQAVLSDGTKGDTFKGPSGKSTGKNEAKHENDMTRAVPKVRLLAKALLAATLPITAQAAIDNLLVNASITGIDQQIYGKVVGKDNSTLAVSLAVAKAAANYLQLKLAQYVQTLEPSIARTKGRAAFFMNIFNGGLHADNGVKTQEFMLVTNPGKTNAQQLAMGDKVYGELKNVLAEKGFETNRIGDEGGFAPKNIGADEKALEFIEEGMKRAGVLPEGPDHQSNDIAYLALDVAASSFHEVRDGKHMYNFNGEWRTSKWMVDYYKGLKKRYSFLVSIEDGLAEDDWEGWAYFTQEMGIKGKLSDDEQQDLNLLWNSGRLKEHVLLVGDDLFVTQGQYLQKGIDQGAGNSILIKVNQEGTLTGALSTMKRAVKNGFGLVMSHRSGETDDTTIAHLAYATKVLGLKTGAPRQKGPDSTEPKTLDVRRSKYAEMINLERVLNATPTVADLLKNISNAVNVKKDTNEVEIVNEDEFLKSTLGYLVNEARFSEVQDVRHAAQRILREAGIASGVKEASIHDFYMARVQGKWQNATVPAYNIRVNAFDTMKQLLRAAKEDNSAFILELANSERRYTDQELSEFTAMGYAAAMAVGYKGLLHFQGDHYQTTKDKFNEGAEGRTKAIGDVETLIREALLAGKRNIDVDPSTLVNEPALEKVLAFQKEKVNRYIHNRSAEDGKFADIVANLGGIQDDVTKESAGMKTLRRKLVDDLEVGYETSSDYADYRNSLSAEEQGYIDRFGLSEDEKAQIIDLYKEMHETTVELTIHYIRYIRNLEKELGISRPISIGVEERHIDTPKHKDFPSTVRGSVTLMRQVTDLSFSEGLVGPSKLALQTGTMHGMGGVVEWGIYERHQRARKAIGVEIFVQHGTSTLNPDDFPNMPAAGTGEAHLATEYQKISLGIIAARVPALRAEMVSYLLALINPDAEIKDPEIVAKLKKAKLFDPEKRRKDFANKFKAKWDVAMAQDGKTEDAKLNEIFSDSLQGKLKGSLKDLVKELPGPFKYEIATLRAEVQKEIDDTLYAEFKRINKALNIIGMKDTLEAINPIANVEIVLPARPTGLATAVSGFASGRDAAHLETDWHGENKPWRSALFTAIGVVGVVFLAAPVAFWAAIAFAAFHGAGFIRGMVETGGNPFKAAATHTNVAGASTLLQGEEIMHNTLRSIPGIGRFFAATNVVSRSVDETVANTFAPVLFAIGLPVIAAKAIVNLLHPTQVAINNDLLGALETLGKVPHNLVQVSDNLTEYLRNVLRARGMIPEDQILRMTKRELLTAA